MIKRATVTTWAEWFEKHEGVRISNFTIRTKLKETGRVGETARNKIGRLLRNAYFSEQDVRASCADLLRPLPQADENGFFVLGGVRHGSVGCWSLDLGISEAAISSHLRFVSVQPVRGKDRSGRITDFYPEPAVRSACADLLRPLPQADESGFVILDGVRHGTIANWFHELGFSQRAVTGRLIFSSVTSVRGKDRSGRITDFYPEPAVRSACADLFQEMPQVDDSGFLVRDGVRHGTAFTWSRELGISHNTIVSRFRSTQKQTVIGKGSDGRLRDFYSEPAVREACADLLAKKKK
ncbi:hypothetical protein HZA44_03750 [Candidatus Peregrinibacteria bacterium]|nr:hypothetical protein [Candidatus Peregrinibacteria bacterium]